MKPDKYRTSDKALAAYLIYFGHTHVGTGMSLSNPKVTPKKYAEILKKI